MSPGHSRHESIMMNYQTVGDDDDLQTMYHDGSKRSYCRYGYRWVIYCWKFYGSLTNAGITETMLYAVPDGAVQFILRQ